MAWTTSPGRRRHRRPPVSGRSDGATNPPKSRKNRLTSKTPIQHPDGVGREPEPKSPWPTADAREHTSRRTGTWNMRLTRRWRGLADRRSDQVRQSRRNMAGLYRAQEAGTGDEGILDGCDGDGGSAMRGEMGRAGW